MSLSLVELSVTIRVERQRLNKRSAEVVATSPGQVKAVQSLLTREAENC